MISSSELSPSLLSPGIRPTLLHGGITHGHVVVPADVRRERGSLSHRQVTADS
jgi:hypothetical protein